MLIVNSWCIHVLTPPSYRIAFPGFLFFLLILQPNTTWRIVAVLFCLRDNATWWLCESTEVQVGVILQMTPCFSHQLFSEIPPCWYYLCWFSYELSRLIYHANMSVTLLAMFKWVRYDTPQICSNRSPWGQNTAAANGGGGANCAGRGWLSTDISIAREGETEKGRKREITAFLSAEKNWCFKNFIKCNDHVVLMWSQMINKGLFPLYYCIIQC